MKKKVNSRAVVRVYNAYEQRERNVIAVLRQGPLFLHKSVDHSEWTITHEPTGCRVASVESREVAEKLMRSLRSADWRFRSPKSRKVKALEPRVRRAMERYTGQRSTIETRAW